MMNATVIVEINRKSMIKEGLYHCITGKHMIVLEIPKLCQIDGVLWFSFDEDLSYTNKGPQQAQITFLFKVYNPSSDCLITQ